MDVIGLSLVTIGHKASELTQKLFHGGEYTRYLYLHGISVETAEALAELQHRNMRQELGIAGEDAPRISDLFHQKYRGSRYSFGYPACPAHGRSDQAVQAAAAGGDDRGEADDRIHARSGAVHLGDRGASSGGEVFCGVILALPQTNSEPG